MRVDDVINGLLFLVSLVIVQNIQVSKTSAL